MVKEDTDKPVAKPANGKAAADAGENFTKFQECAANVLNVEVEQVTPDATFAQLDADSLDIVELLMALEEAFGIEIEEDELDGIETVEQAYTLVSSKL